MGSREPQESGGRRHREGGGAGSTGPSVADSRGGGRGGPAKEGAEKLQKQEPAGLPCSHLEVKPRENLLGLVTPEL